MIATKLSQDTAGYDTSGMQSGYRCGTCANFKPSGACTVVSGKLDATDCCNLWTRKQRTMLTAPLDPANAVVVRDSEPSHQCSLCRYWKGPHDCIIVTGNINPKATCYFWEKA